MAGLCSVWWSGGQEHSDILHHRGRGSAGFWICQSALHSLHAHMLDGLSRFPGRAISPSLPSMIFLALFPLEMENNRTHIDGDFCLLHSLGNWEKFPSRREKMRSWYFSLTWELTSWIVTLFSAIPLCVLKHTTYYAYRLCNRLISRFLLRFSMPTLLH